jgi:hypothetical protein
MKNNTLATVFTVIGWIVIVTGIILFLVFLGNTNIYSVDTISSALIVGFFGLLLLAIGEVIRLLSKIENNTNKTEYYLRKFFQEKNQNKPSVSHNIKTKGDLNDPEVLSNLLEQLKIQQQ